jgi:hypothetical protein
MPIVLTAFFVTFSWHDRLVIFTDCFESNRKMSALAFSLFYFLYVSSLLVWVELVDFHLQELVCFQFFEPKDLVHPRKVEKL